MSEPAVIESDAQCAWCGSSVVFEDCEMCPARGYYDGPDPDCMACRGTGTVKFCLSLADWCEANPLPGHEHVPGGTVEFFEILSDGTTRVSGYEPPLRVVP